MTPLLSVALGFLVGAAMVYLMERPVRAHLQSELAYYRQELVTAQDRLLHAWREDRAVIPPRPVAVELPKPLPPELQDAVNEWESAEGRAAAEANLRSLYFEKGWGVPAILKHLQNT